MANTALGPNANTGDYAYAPPAQAHAAQYYAQPGPAMSTQASSVFPSERYAAERYPCGTGDEARRLGTGETTTNGWMDEATAGAASAKSRTDRSTLTAASGLASLGELRTPPTPEMIALPPIVDVNLGQMGMGMMGL